MHYTYDYLKADTLDRLLFLMNVNGQRGYKLVGKIVCHSLYDRETDSFVDEYSCLMEREEQPHKGIIARGSLRELSDAMDRRSNHFNFGEVKSYFNPCGGHTVFYVEATKR